jgi:Membrane-associated lipoprotein involved in thiamine biosynthesis
MNSPHEIAPLTLRDVAGTPSTYVGRAWSCTVRLVVEDERALRPAVQDLTALLDRVDAAASRFRADSALSVANRRAGRPTPVPKLLVDLAAAALDAAAQTGGAVDPTLGLAVQDAGYDRDIAEVLHGDLPAPQALSRPLRRKVNAWRQVRLDRSSGLLTVPPGTALDLGATAKAWTADHAARALARRYETAVLVELGGDLAVAGGGPDGWCVQVAEREGADGQLVLLRHGGLATSTTTVRQWRRDGRPMHHLIDPATGLPADGPWRTASVAAPCALAANVAATAAIVRSADAVDRLTRRGLAARLVAQDGTVTTTLDWPQETPLTLINSASGTACGASARVDQRRTVHTAVAR